MLLRHALFLEGYVVADAPSYTTCPDANLIEPFASPEN